jgi:hypothetical protein
MRRFLTAAAVLGSIAATNGRASADLITYTETVVASGSLGGVQFTGALVTIVATADTAGVVRLQQFPAILAVDNASATILVAGLGEATFTTPTFTYVNTIDRGLGNNARSGIEAGTIAQPSIDILDVNSTAFTSYDLKTPFGPINGRASGGGGGQFSFDTSSGALFFDSFAFAPATFVAGVPEPSSLSLAIVGVVGLTMVARRRPRGGRMAPSGDDLVAKSHCSEGPCAHLLDSLRPIGRLWNY